MASNALYFPYIDLPKNRFTNTALLYWDKILTISPRGTDFVLKPENENDLLIREEAIKPIRPEDYSSGYPNFGANFIRLIDGIDLERVYPRQGGWAATADAAVTASRIHTGKVLTDNLYEMLKARCLLIEPQGPWLMVEPITADLFMHYLSQCLAQDPALDCFPVTDEPFDTARIMRPRGRPSTDEHFCILNRLLPVTAELLSAEQVLKIRAKHHNERLAFRESIERFVNEELAAITDQRDRNAQIDSFIIRKRDEIRHIEDQLEEFSRDFPTRVMFAALGFMTAGVAAVDLLHGGAFSSVSEALLDGAGFGGTMIYAARGAVKDLREGAPELKREMAFAALVNRAPTKAPFWSRMARVFR
jgi:hypothetical protein